jgi:hypothetical protein
VGDFLHRGDQQLANHHPSNGSWWLSVPDGDRFATTRHGTSR